MGFFNFIENFFFLSLAITFVLILLLVYHFKQRITSLEQKNDTMFEIANGLVKEVGAMKAYILNTISTQMNYPFSSVSLHKVNDTNNEENEEEEEEDEEEDEEEEEEEDEEEDEENEGEEEEEEDEEEDEEEEDEDEEDDDDEDIEGLIYEDLNKEETNDICVVNDDTDNDINEDEEELKIVEVSLNELENDGLDTKENELRVNKIETDPIAPVNQKQTPKTEIDSYKRMNVNQLKAFIIEKGYTTDFKNLKRNDLIKIIEDSETK
jgi:hypothetical protein